MARLVSLKFAAGITVVGLDAILAGSLCADTLAPAQNPPAEAQPRTAAAKAPATNAPAAHPQDLMGRYQKIFIPGDEAAHPLRLKLPSPDSGEVRVPTPDELGLREKLEQLATLSDEEIHVQLEAWPTYSKMSLRDQAMMLSRIQDFRDFRNRVAMQKAHDMGLLTLTPDQRTKFEKAYWDKRLQMDRDLTKQLGPIFTAREQKMDDELLKEFSSGTGPIVQGPKAPQPGPPATAANPATQVPR